MDKKSPVRHRVVSHTRKNRHVRSYTRGKGKPENKFFMGKTQAKPKVAPKPKPERSEFYTQHGWKGTKYEETHNKLSLKEIAQRIKKEVLLKHPEIGLSVKTKHFSGGRSIEIDVTAYPGQIRDKVLSPHLREKYDNTPPSEIPQYAYDYRHVPKAQALLDDIQKIANQYRFDDSDSMIDYSFTNFYCTPQFGHEVLKAEEKRYGWFQ